MKRTVEIKACKDCVHYRGAIWTCEDGATDYYNGVCHNPEAVTLARMGISSKYTTFVDDFPSWCPLEISEDGDSIEYPPTGEWGREYAS